MRASWRIEFTQLVRNVLDELLIILYCLKLQLTQYICHWYQLWEVDSSYPSHFIFYLLFLRKAESEECQKNRNEWTWLYHWEKGVLYLFIIKLVQYLYFSWHQTQNNMLIISRTTMQMKLCIVTVNTGGLKVG